MVRRAVLLALIVTTSVLTGIVVAERLRPVDPVETPPIARSAVSAGSAPVSPPAAPAAAAVPDFTRIADQTIRGVTNISSLQPQRRTNSPFANDPFFQYFFGDVDMFGERNRRELSLGSGVVVSSDGYILTNVHVLGALTRGTEVRVALSDKREIRAQIIGVDELTDIALVKINERHLPVIPWGDSSQLKVAEWVLAIGNPFQLSQTVTLGIVSALGRSNIGAASYEDFIQTDAAINPGNSGGALINSRGAIGLFETLPLTPELARQLGVGNTRGVVIAAMDKSGSAFRSGLQLGDVVTDFNGTAITDAAQFARVVADAPIGTTAVVRVQRGDERVNLEIPIEQATRRRSR
jgi:serine protease Do